MNDKLLTTEDLNKFLHKELIASVKGERIPQMTLVIEQNLEEADEVAISQLGALGAILGAKGVLQCNAYWEIRDRVHAYQRQHSVSGLTFEEININGKLVKVPSVCDQLILLPDDIDILKAFTPRAMELFKEWVEAYNAYVYFNQFDKEGGEWNFETTLRYVEHVSTCVDWARLDEGQESERHEPYLTLELGWGDIAAARFRDDKSGDSFYFYAERSCAYYKPDEIQTDVPVKMTLSEIAEWRRSKED